MENYMRYRYNPNCNIKMKHGVIPHKFNWPESESSLASSSCSTVTVNVLQQTEEIEAVVTKNVGILVKPSIRSYATLCNIPKSNVSNKKVGTLDSSIQHTSSPERLAKRRKFLDTQPSSSEFIPTSQEVTDNFNSEMQSESENKLDSEKKMALDVTIKFIEKYPKRYVGIPDKWLIILTSELSQVIPREELYLCLMKIKANDTLTRLADQFGYSVSQASRIFKKNILIIEHHLQPFIFWPEKQLIKKHLPIQFRANYSEVQSIIDCLEIEIEKPSHPVLQAMTWSEYKKCNTIKYLISCTPDGFINYVSKGYGGRTSDILITEVSDFLKVAPNNCSIMADRGFKGITKFLTPKNCVLVKPPSVSSKEKPTKEEVLLSKRIASVRIHIERVIRRVREFSFLKPHSVINHQLIGYTDAVIVIACALINMQSFLIKS